MKIAMHQPYLFSYRGYFDLIDSVDKFVFYDDAKYMKGKFINRNYFPDLFTFRLEKHSDYAKINECYFKDIEEDKLRFKSKFPNLPHKYVDMLQNSYNLSYNIAFSTIAICKDLGIHTDFYFSSQIPHGRFVDGIKDVVVALGGDTYINLPGGKELYNQDMFEEIKLEFLDTKKGPSILCEL